MNTEQSVQEWRIERRQVIGPTWKRRNVCYVVTGYGSAARYMLNEDGTAPKQFNLAGAREAIAKATA